jgi:hypothetical protein
MTLNVLAQRRPPAPGPSWGDGSGSLRPKCIAKGENQISANVMPAVKVARSLSVYAMACITDGPIIDSMRTLRTQAVVYAHRAQGFNFHSPIHPATSKPKATR